jgi:hypothetical protein
MPPPLEAIDDVLDALDGAYGTCLRLRRLAPSPAGREYRRHRVVHLLLPSTQPGEPVIAHRLTAGDSHEQPGQTMDSPSDATSERGSTGHLS